MSTGEEFSKSIVALHRSLIFGTAVVLAFALSIDPTEDLVQARDSLVEVKKIDVANFVKEVTKKFSVEINLPDPQVESKNPNLTSANSTQSCFKNKEIKVSYTLGIVLVPDVDTESVSSLIDMLSHGDVFWLQASKESIAALLQTRGINCEISDIGRLVAIRVGAADSEIKQLPNGPPEVRKISSLSILKYKKNIDAKLPIAEYQFFLRNALSKAATIELEYAVNDGFITTSLLSGDVQLASPAANVIEAPFAYYLPSIAGRKTEILGALQNKLGLIGDKTVDRALEFLHGEILEKTKNPSIYGIQIGGKHAVWGIPALLASLMFFLLAHVHAYIATTAKFDGGTGAVPNILLYEGLGPDLIRITTLIVLPALSSVLLILRLSPIQSLVAILGMTLSCAIATMGWKISSELATLRARARMVADSSELT